MTSGHLQRPNQHLVWKPLHYQYQLCVFDLLTTYQRMFVKIVAFALLKSMQSFAVIIQNGIQLFTVGVVFYCL